MRIWNVVHLLKIIVFEHPVPFILISMDNVHRVSHARTSFPEHKFTVGTILLLINYRVGEGNKMRGKLGREGKKKKIIA